MPRPNFKFHEFFARERHQEPFVARPPRYRASLGLPKPTGSRARATPEVKQFAGGFSSNVAGIREMVDTVSAFQVVPSKFARLAYGRRTVNDIIASRKIPSIKRPLTRVRGHDYTVGCVDMCDVLIAGLHAKGIRASHVRSILGLQDLLKMKGRHIMEKAMGHNVPHSYVRFQFQGKEYLADPFSSNPSRRIIPLNKDSINLLSLLEGFGKLREGSDSWDKRIGLYSFGDFLKEADILGSRKK
ncbi:MAG: hypothetical protein JW744_01345 [Candidatus Diapherotrites archaeon]|uniref:Uncharacterized protein n=1 Tax=Candidatus Iainarchaeum sp. TaxID=3101447 RepID=A0A938YWS0_9ARCH|nr:hypothetical protein [Candidatus Diapherotrites archaeon]